LAAPLAYRLVEDGGTGVLVKVDEPPNLGNPLYPDEAPKDAPTAQQVEGARSDRSARLRALVPSDAAARNVRTEIDLVEDVAREIEEEARRRRVDAVVLSSHGRWGLARLAHGEPVATRLLHRKDLDVVVVHSDRP
jgi:nucleotide-binding universal stress UspA family protein